MTYNLDGSTVIWSEKNYLVYAKETYLRNVISYQCMNLIAKAVSSVEWFLGTENEEGEIVKVKKTDSTLLKRPNPWESFTTFMYSVVCYYLIQGDSYVQGIKVGNSENALPKEMYTIQPDKITIKCNEDGQKIAYVYKEDGKVKKVFEIDLVTGKSDLLHFKMFNPVGNKYGASITQTASRDIDTSNEATKWNMKILQNEGRPGMVVAVHGSLTDDQFERLKKQLNSSYSGSENAGKTIVVESEDGVAKVSPYNWSPKDIDFLEGGRETARKIAMGYGVPPLLLGMPGDNTYANYKEARTAFYEDTVLYYLNFFRDELNNWLYGGMDREAWQYNLDKVPAFAEKRNMLWTRANEAGYLTINEKRKLTGYKPVIGGDIVLTPANMLPLDFSSNPDTEGE